MSVSVGSGSLNAWQLWAAQQQAQQKAARAADITSGGTTAATSTSADPGAVSFTAELQGLMSQLQQLGGTGDGSSASAIGQAGTAASAMPPWGPTNARDGTTSPATAVSADASKLVSDLQAFIVQLHGDASSAGATGAASGTAASATGVSATGVPGTGVSGTGAVSGTGNDLAATLASDLQTFISAMQSGQGSAPAASAGATNASTSDTDTDGDSAARPASAHRHHHHHVAEALGSYASQSGTQSSNAVSATTSVSA